jgi:heat shock protein HslJ
MKKYLIWVIAVLFALPTNAQKFDKSKTKLEDIIGKTWYPIQSKGEHGVFGFQIRSLQEMSGHDGCNNFYVDYEYSSEKGFKILRTVSTRLACPSQEESFGVSFLHNVRSFELIGDTLIFYGLMREPIMTVYGHLIIKEDSTQNKEQEFSLLVGNWVLRSSNNAHFTVLQSKKTNIYINIPLVGHHLSFSGIEESKSFNFLTNFYVWKNMSVHITNNPANNLKKMKERAPNAYTLYEDFLKATSYEMLEGKLLIRNQYHTYTFERLP